MILISLDLWSPLRCISSKRFYLSYKLLNILFAMIENSPNWAIFVIKKEFQFLKKSANKP